ncbi:hypothetical protein GCM10023144_35540 [Pigmentiphaga soli]|uniref:Putative 4-hydroxy-4-methyl-2-oxoglutarate aldolase n=1 Tax=Pigmentiphaga soli TaxID=1007095 RepID=A0ABP8HFI1_9BURK
MNDAIRSARPEAADPGLAARLAKLPTGVVWDVLRVMGLPHQAVDASIAGLESSMALCGPAFCVKGQTWLGALPKPDPRLPQPRYELFDHLYPGCIMVVDSGRYGEAVLMGENFAISAVAAGCAGFVLDGATRDAQSLVDQRIPVFKRFVTPASSAGRWSITHFEVPITLPGQTSAGVPVHPGDFVLADRDGVVIVPRQHAARVADYAARVDEIEQIQRKELIEGKDDRRTIYERYDRFAHIEPIARD